MYRNFRLWHILHHLVLHCSRIKEDMQKLLKQRNATTFESYESLRRPKCYCIDDHSDER